MLPTLCYADRRDIRHQQLEVYDEFVGQVQNRARLDSSGAAVKAIRATLQTLAERLHSNEAQDLSAQLPEEIDRYLEMAGKME